MRYRNRYRIPSARLLEHDYAAPGLYFVTCCTHHRAPVFGTLGEHVGVRLSRLGHVAASVWHRIPWVYPTVSLEALVVMPDHVHALLHLHGADVSASGIVRQSKRATTRAARDWGWTGALWQARFHDRLVRDGREAEAVRRYIAHNPFRHAAPP